MKTLSHYASKFNLMVLVTEHEHDDLEVSFQKFARVLGIPPGSISYRWHFKGKHAPRKNVTI